MNDAIFLAAGLMESAWREIEHLCNTVERDLRTAKLQPAYEGDEERDGASFAYIYSLGGVFKRRRTPAQLLLGFDLHRPGATGGWEPGTTALLIVAHEPRLDDGWEFERVAFDGDGRFTDPETKVEVRPDPMSGGRLLVWGGAGGGDPYSKLAWLYAVRLRDISNPAALERNIVAPVVTLLTDSAAPLSALISSDAVAWPSSPAR